MSTKQAEEPRKWLDFDAIKRGVDVEALLEDFGVRGLERKGDELVGWCPLGTKKHGKKDSFSFNIEKKTFQCFACRQRGSVLDFVAKVQVCSLREAAEYVHSLTEGAWVTDEGGTAVSAARQKIDDTSPAPSSHSPPHVMALDVAHKYVTQGAIHPDDLIVLNKRSLKEWLGAGEWLLK